MNMNLRRLRESMMDREALRAARSPGVTKIGYNWATELNCREIWVSFCTVEFILWVLFFFLPQMRTFLSCFVGNVFSLNFKISLLPQWKCFCTENKQTSANVWVFHQNGVLCMWLILWLTCFPYFWMPIFELCGSCLQIPSRRVGPLPFLRMATEYYILWILLIILYSSSLPS